MRIDYTNEMEEIFDIFQKVLLSMDEQKEQMHKLTHNYEISVSVLPNNKNLRDYFSYYQNFMNSMITFHDQVKYLRDCLIEEKDIFDSTTNFL